MFEDGGNFIILHSVKLSTSVNIPMQLGTSKASICNTVWVPKIRYSVTPCGIWYTGNSKLVDICAADKQLVKPVSVTSP